MKTKQEIQIRLMALFDIYLTSDNTVLKSIVKPEIEALEWVLELKTKDNENTLEKTI